MFYDLLEIADVRLGYDELLVFEDQGFSFSRFTIVSNVFLWLSQYCFKNSNQVRKESVYQTNLISSGAGFHCQRRWVNDWVALRNFPVEVLEAICRFACPGEKLKTVVGDQCCGLVPARGPC
ncbi:hypothetical protein NPIL_438651 [Nephila pilipes]|uniref:Uncharacterized protein n=1 Tax=Nephila pilipes TaxID=299642 RepID=A0A8X6MRU1_NEPPI|nr:hypothetical protein NPIL_438651 [Nephila pilipes]